MTISMTRIVTWQWGYVTNVLRPKSSAKYRNSQTRILVYTGMFSKLAMVPMLYSEPLEGPGLWVSFFSRFG